HDIEIIYWDQGGGAVFRVELKKDGGSYDYVNSSNYPLLSTYGYSAAIGEAFTVDVDILLANDTDTEGDTLSVVSVENASNGASVSLLDGIVTLTPVAGFSGIVTFDYTISDGTATDTATVTVGYGAAIEVSGDQSGSSDDITEITTPKYTTAANDIINVSNGNIEDVVYKTGAGNDVIITDNDQNIQNGADIDMGSGNDTITLSGDKLDTDSIIEMGDGVDKLILEDYSSTDFNGTDELLYDAITDTLTVNKEDIDFQVSGLEEIYFAQDSTTYVISTGKFIDGIVEGLQYTTSSGMSGLTDATGGFTYFVGDSVTFSIGNVVIGTIDTDAMQDKFVFLQDLADTDRTDVNDEYVENMAVLLQSLDVDNDAYNGIVITDAMRSAFSDDNFDLANISEEDLVTLIESTGQVALSEDVAMEHVQDMLELHGGLDASDFDDRVLDEVPVNETVDKESQVDSSDILIGNEQADTFVWLENDSAIDHVSDFDLSEDVIDISDLLQISKSDNLSDFLDFDSDGTDTTITVHAEGGDEISQTIVLDGVDLGSNDVNIINDMLTGSHQGSLFIGNDIAVDSITTVVDIPDE
ncbi:MAG: hypothetical protein ACI952_000001, partial [Flavobacteriales bacterium]